MANTFNRPDTFLGICEAIGQDLGIHSNWLRAALGVMVLWQPLWAILGYLAAGLLVLALRLLVPDPAAPIETPAVEHANDEVGLREAA